MISQTIFLEHRCCSAPLFPPLSCLQLLDSDQDLYKNFPLVISERWQQEVAETVYEAVNSDTDKNEARKRAKNKQQGHEEGTSCDSTVALTGHLIKTDWASMAPWGKRVRSLTWTLAHT